MRHKNSTTIRNSGMVDGLLRHRHPPPPQFFLNLPPLPYMTPPMCPRFPRERLRGAANYPMPPSEMIPKLRPPNQIINIQNHAPALDIDPDKPLDLTKKSLAANDSKNNYSDVHDRMMDQYLMHLYKCSSLSRFPGHVIPYRPSSVYNSFYKCHYWNDRLNLNKKFESTKPLHVRAGCEHSNTASKSPGSATQTTRMNSAKDLRSSEFERLCESTLSKGRKWREERNLPQHPAASVKLLSSPDGPFPVQRRGCSGGGKQPVTRCFQCSSQFSSLVDLNRHFLQEHEPSLRHEFELARSWKSLAVEDMCMQDLETVVRRGDTETTGYQCPHCDYFAKWPTELQKHIMVHSKERPHQCIICGLTYKWKWDLGRHFDKSHSHAANPYKKNTGEPVHTETGVVKSVGGQTMTGCGPIKHRKKVSSPDKSKLISHYTDAKSFLPQNSAEKLSQIDSGNPFPTSRNEVPLTVFPSIEEEKGLTVVSPNRVRQYSSYKKRNVFSIKGNSRDKSLTSLIRKSLARKKRSVSFNPYGYKLSLKSQTDRQLKKSIKHRISEAISKHASSDIPQVWGPIGSEKLGAISKNLSHSQDNLAHN